MCPTNLSFFVTEVVVNRIPINGIIPEIAAIGVIATVVLSGIAGTIVGGVAGYLVNVAINQCCGACSSVVQE
ncbi:hypothetical protein H9I48_00500 [Wolbachia pipientis]|jgi:hypothetical protein|uniref:hypothetical protein n=1 Tax=Wolbachia pipientis TaxID=955 RepID=UPI0016518D55|nr:hypothetical protein [Wolbachia pipientis]MBC6685745.1 hypothetical protein [Wolbachia pipientis]